MYCIQLASFLCLFIYLAQPHQIISQQLNGEDRLLRKENKQIPKHYICGAAVWKKKEYTPALQRCETICSKKRPCFIKKKDVCKPIPEVHNWTRINGIAFKYCHFQNWNSQFELEQRGSYQWMGMKLCPPGMYVNGMRTKLNERDGLAGLVLHCSNSKNSSQTADILILDGEGPWRDSLVSGRFAFGFKVRMREQWIYGLNLQMAPFPSISAFKIRYSLPQNFNTTLVNIQKITVNNLGSSVLVKQIQITKRKQFKRIWQNDKGQLHEYNFSQLLSKGLQATLTIPIPFISAISPERKELTKVRRQEKLESFRFGVLEAFEVGQKQKDVINISPCTKHTILQTVHICDSSIPYTVQLSFSNGLAVENETFGGVYKGISVGEVETSVTMQNLCRKYQ